MDSRMMQEEADKSSRWLQFVTDGARIYAGIVTRSGAYSTPKDAIEWVISYGEMMEKKFQEHAR